MKPGWNEQRMTIGRPIANTTIHILDARGRPAPIGVPGEIYVGGKGLARGYLGLPELTRRCFTPRPRATGSDMPLYRTGDRGRYFADGTIEYLGRVDRQIQIRGHRTEPAEIEVVLGAHPAVTQAVVKPATSKQDETFLVAYVVPSFEGAATDRELRAFVQDRLPAAMVPAAIVFMERLPLTSNGKVDTERLTAPDRDEMRREHSVVPPRSPLEEVVAAVWSQVLDLESLGVHDHFFELGGHSLLATRAVSQLAETLRVEIPIRLIFEAPTVARFAAALEALPDKEAIAETAAAVVAVASLSDLEVRGQLGVQRDEQG
jgi:hypothetical protein